ncbi:MAG: hypothetical protein Kow0069_33010 [Promethearchaeota archaeon]
MAKMVAEMDRRFDAAEWHREKIRVTLLAMENKTGPELESLVFKLMREPLLAEGIDPDGVEEAVLFDRDGRVYAPGYSTQIDVVLSDEQLWLVEVKATADHRDAWDLTKKAELYELLRGRRPDRLYLVALHMRSGHAEYARTLGVRTILGEFV